MEKLSLILNVWRTYLLNQLEVKYFFSPYISQLFDIVMKKLLNKNFIFMQMYYFCPIYLLVNGEHICNVCHRRDLIGVFPLRAAHISAQRVCDWTGEPLLISFHAANYSEGTARASGKCCFIDVEQSTGLPWQNYLSHEASKSRSFMNTCEELVHQVQENI